MKKINKIIIIILLILFIILLSILIYINIRNNIEHYSNLKQIIVSKKNKNLKIISKNIPLSIKKKCNLMRRKYPNIKACLIKKNNYELNKEQLDEINKNENDKINLRDVDKVDKVYKKDKELNLNKIKNSDECLKIF